MKLKKIFGGILLSAALVSSVSTAVWAAGSTLTMVTGCGDNKSSESVGKYYTSANFNNDNYDLEPVSFIQGFYESKNIFHNARAGTHYNAGSIYGECYAIITYVDSNGNIKQLTGERSSRNKGWSESPWTTMSNSYKSIKYIKFCAAKYTSTDINAKPFMEDYFFVYAA